MLSRFCAWQRARSPFTAFGRDGYGFLLLLLFLLWNLRDRLEEHLRFVQFQTARTNDLLV
jgi:hypothetical protein